MTVTRYLSTVREKRRGCSTLECGNRWPFTMQSGGGHIIGHAY
jgi:hypothetical protein